MAFTPEELAEMAAYDAEIDESFELTSEERKLSLALDRAAKSTDTSGSAYYQAHRAARIAYARDWQNRNRERDKANKRAWYQKNKDHSRAYRKEYYKQNAEKIRERNNAYYYRNRDTILAKAKARRDAKKAGGGAV